eukprot:m.228997 g.228997  ORF g.228997 m.228997 type:complete len:235 (+) comp54255_c0_seq2:722-1426(+)
MVSGHHQSPKCLALERPSRLSVCSPCLQFFSGSFCHGARFVFNFGSIILSVINPPAICSSGPLEDEQLVCSIFLPRYGPELRICEGTTTKGSLSGWIKGFLGVCVINLLLLLLVIPPTRFVLKKFLFKPGQGPSREDLEKGFLRGKFVATSQLDASGNRHKVFGDVHIKRDAGYLETATMLGECAVCLARDARQLRMAAGFLTPASAMGTVLLERLRAQDLSFSLTPAGRPKSD